MIAPAFDTNFRHIKGMPTAGITDSLINVYYPQLSIFIDYIDTSISELFGNDSTARKAILHRIQQELGGMVSKEKMILFPLLATLEREDRKSDCGPFKLVKKHYHSLLSAIQSLKYLLQEDTVSNKITPELLKQVNDLESGIVELQRAKEKHLFNRFKSCNNNCQISAYASQ